MSAVLLLSGGIDSAVLLARERAAQRTPLSVFIDYGQRAAQREWAAASQQAQLAGSALTRLDLSQLGNAFREQREHKLHVPLPHRNLVALALGVSYAANVGATQVLLALNRDDENAYPSAGKSFIGAFRAVAASLGDFDIATPLVELDKRQVVEAGIALGVNFAQTWSCLLGYAMPCRRCNQCRSRAAALQHFPQTIAVS